MRIMIKVETWRSRNSRSSWRGMQISPINNAFILNIMCIPTSYKNIISAIMAKLHGDLASIREYGYIEEHHFLHEVWRVNE